MTVDLQNRTRKLTNAEFRALPRNAEGRITGEFDFAWIWMTEKQKESLTGDDQSRGYDLDEDLRYELDSFLHYEAH